MNFRSRNLVVYPDGPGAGLSFLSVGNVFADVANTVSDLGSADFANFGQDGRTGTRLTCESGKLQVNGWGSVGLEGGAYGSNDLDTTYATLGLETDLGNATGTECGRFKAGAFAFAADSEIDEYLGSTNQVDSYGLGLYLRGSTESQFYGSVMGFVGRSENHAFNAVMDASSKYDSDDWGARLDVGKLFVLKDENLHGEMTAHVGVVNNTVDAFVDSDAFEVTGIDSDSLLYGASFGLRKYMSSEHQVFGQIGIDVSDIDSTLTAYTLPVDSSPSYELGKAAIGWQFTDSEGWNFKITGHARFGDEVEAAGPQVAGSVRF